MMSECGRLILKMSVPDWYYGLGLDGPGLGLEGWGFGLEILALTTSLRFIKRHSRERVRLIFSPCVHTHTHTHTRPFNGHVNLGKPVPLLVSTRDNRYSVFVTRCHSCLQTVLKTSAETHPSFNHQGRDIAPFHVCYRTSVPQNHHLING